MVFGPTLAPMMKQCGIYDEFVTLGKKNESINVLNSSGGKEYSVNFSDGKEMYVHPSSCCMHLLAIMVKPVPHQCTPC